jgi:hypothetical protein
MCDPRAGDGVLFDQQGRHAHPIDARDEFEQLSDQKWREAGQDRHRRNRLGSLNLVPYPSVTDMAHRLSVGHRH